MKNIRIIVFALLAVCALVAGLQLGFDSTSFAFNALMAMGVAVAPLFKRADRAPGMFACDDDPVAMLKSAVDDFKAAKSKLEKEQDGLKGAHQLVQDAIAKGLKLDTETQANVDKAISLANEQSLAVKDFAQKMDDLRKSFEAGPTRPLDLRQSIRKELEGDGGANKGKMEVFKDSGRGTMRLTMKDITSADVSTGMKREDHIDSLVSLERQPLRIRNLLSVVPVQTDSVKYGKQTVRTNAAAIVPEGESKPYSTYKWENATASVEVIAHLAKMTLQALADAPRLAAEIENEMRYGYMLAEENELLNGDGTANHLSGLMLNATAYAVPAGMDTTGIINKLDRLRVAMLQIHLAYAVPDAHVLNPINVAEIDLMRRDPDMGGGYLFGNPDTETGVLRLWRLPTVESPSMLVNKFLTGAFKYAASLYDRQGITVAISSENEDDFEKNLATMRVEGRVGLGVRRPYALVKGDLVGSGS